VQRKDHRETKEKNQKRSPEKRRRASKRKEKVDGSNEAEMPKKRPKERGDENSTNEYIVENCNISKDPVSENRRRAGLGVVQERKLGGVLSTKTQSMAQS